jgi:hypothetical protein
VSSITEEAAHKTRKVKFSVFNLCNAETNESMPSHIPKKLVQLPYLHEYKIKIFPTLSEKQEFALTIMPKVKYILIIYFPENLKGELSSAVPSFI